MNMHTHIPVATFNLNARRFGVVGLCSGTWSNSSRLCSSTCSSGVCPSTCSSSLGSSSCSRRICSSTCSKAKLEVCSSCFCADSVSMLCAAIVYCE